MARKGDLIVVNAQRVGGPPREGEILEVIERELRVQYRIRWSDGHESVFAPGAGTARIEPARDREKTSSQRTELKRSPAQSTAQRSRPTKSASKKASAKTARGKKSTSKKSTSKSAAKASMAKRSTARKAATKKAAARGRTSVRRSREATARS